MGAAETSNRHSLTFFRVSVKCRTLPTVPRLFYPRGMGFRRLTTLSDLGKQGYWCQLTCKCGHERRCDPDKLMMRLARRGADIRLARLGDTLKCGKCGRKDFTATHCNGPTVATGYWPKGPNEPARR